MGSITVSLPVYNGAEHLEGALKSLLAQTFRDFRILVSDNASTDATPEILARFAAQDSRIEVIRQPQNIGAANNFQFLLHKVETEWLIFACHDDEWSPNYLEVLYETALKNPQAQLVVPQVHITFQDDRPAKQVLAPSPEIFTLPRLQKIRTLLTLAHGSYMYGLFRKDAAVASYRLLLRFPFAWASDLIIILPYILSDAMLAADNRAIFYHLTTDRSWLLYKPRKLSDQCRIYRAFLSVSFSLLCKASLSKGEKAALIVPLWQYAERHSGKIRRIIKTLLLWPFEKHSPITA